MKITDLLEAEPGQPNAPTMGAQPGQQQPGADPSPNPTPQAPDMAKAQQMQAQSAQKQQQSYHNRLKVQKNKLKHNKNKLQQ